MTDFNGFNPNNVNGSQFHTNKKGKGPDEKPAVSNDSAPATDRYADQKLSADDVFNLMNTHASSNAATIKNASILSSVAAFESMVTPEQHASMMRDVEATFEEEFGFSPSASLAESVVSNRLIGKPNIQA